VKPDSFWHRRRTIREGIVVAIVVALSTGVFFGVARVMTALGSSQATALTPPAAQPDDDYADDDYNDTAASGESTGNSDSPQSE
jgi:hypothetical protein